MRSGHHLLTSAISVNIPLLTMHAFKHFHLAPGSEEFASAQYVTTMFARDVLSYLTAAVVQRDAEDTSSS